MEAQGGHIEGPGGHIWPYMALGRPITLLQHAASYDATYRVLEEAIWPPYPGYYAVEEAVRPWVLPGVLRDGGYYPGYTPRTALTALTALTAFSGLSGLSGL